MGTKPVLTVQDLADREGVPKRTVYRWNAEGSAPRRFMVGRYVRYRLEDVEAWEAERLIGSARREEGSDANKA